MRVETLTFIVCLVIVAVTFAAGAAYARRSEDVTDYPWDDWDEDYNDES